VLIYINNYFFGFNPMVFFHQNLFWSNHDFWLIIINVGCLIMVWWLISNMSMSLFCSYLLWILIPTNRAFFHVLKFLWGLICFLQEFSWLCVFASLICFGLWFWFCFFFFVKPVFLLHLMVEPKISGYPDHVKFESFR